MKKTIFLLILISIFNYEIIFSETTVTYREKETVTDFRREYNRKLLKLALEKTRKKYGSYRLVSSGPINIKRVIHALKNNYMANFFVRLSYSDKYMKDLTYIPFPVDRGIVGYRIFLTSREVEQKLAKVKNIDQLKKFTMGQGQGWLDTKILLDSGFKLFVGRCYECFFKMVASKRFDLFPRGANEIYGELRNYRHIRGLTYDKSILLYYPLPRFFFTSKKNTKAKKRIEEGLIKAYKDGSFQRLWENYFLKNIKFLDLKNRMVFRLKNPYLKGIDKSYEKYNYIP